MQIYDGRRDIIAPKTNHTAQAVSCSQIAAMPHDCMTVRKNGRADWSLFYCEEGCVYFEAYTLTAGMTWIYPPQVPQQYTIRKRDGTVYRYLHFTGAELGSLFSSLHIPLQQPIRQQSGRPAELLEEIRQTISADDAASGIRAEAYILQLLSEFSRAAAKTETGAMKRVTDEMEHSLAETYHVKKYADMMHLSVGRFNHLFRQFVGEAPYSYYIRLRMDSACNLLAHSSLRVKEIACSCGYDDPLYFAQAFRKRTGQTPTAFRKNAEKAGD